MHQEVGFFISNYDAIDIIHTNRKVWAGTLSLKQYMLLFEYTVIDDDIKLEKVATGSSVLYVLLAWSKATA